MMPDNTRYYCTSSGRIELEITLDDASSGSHSGPCDEDIAALIRVPYIAAQMAAIHPDLLRDELREWGAWETEELADHDTNLERLLWLACGDIVEESRQ